MGIRETVFTGSDYESTVVDVERLELSRQGLTLEQIAAGNGQVPFASVILPPNAIPGLAFLGGTYELTDLRASWTYEEEYSLGTTTVCSGSGSGVLTEADVFASIFDIAPYLRGALPGDIPSLYRSFFIQLVLFAQGEPVSGQCVGNGTSDPYTKAFGAGVAGGYRNTPEFGNLTIGASGDQINESWSLDELDTDVNVSSTRIPRAGGYKEPRSAHLIQTHRIGVCLENDRLFERQPLFQGIPFLIEIEAICVVW